jgi:hypothetical protein
LATLQLTGTYSGATFKVGTDGAGGTDITLLTTATTPSPVAFVAAMAGTGSGAGAAMATANTVGASMVHPRLALPGLH